MFNKLNVFFIILIGFIPIKGIKVISIGQGCSVAGAMRDYGIRTIAYPFDWLDSPFEAVYQAFDDDFKHFLQEPLTVRTCDRYGITDFYGFTFVHDFPTVQASDSVDVLGEKHMTGGVVRDDWRDFLSIVRDKYARRIERLKKVLLGSEKVYMIRNFDMNRNQAAQFRDLLHKKYPSLDFMLIVIGGTEDMHDNWNLDRIRNFYLDSTLVGHDQEEWATFFQSCEQEKIC